MANNEGSCYKTEKWYESQSNKGKYLADLIFKYHNYFSVQDRKYRCIVRILKITVLVIAMASTIILGLKAIDTDVQVGIGLVLSACITLVTAISSYFNFEEYWMRNISIHIKLNILRDSFVLEAEANSITDERVEHYMKKLNEIQEDNIQYWQKAIKRL